MFPFAETDLLFQFLGQETETFCPSFPLFYEELVSPAIDYFQLILLQNSARSNISQASFKIYLSTQSYIIKRLTIG